MKQNLLLFKLLYNSLPRQAKIRIGNLPGYILLALFLVGFTDTATAQLTEVWRTSSLTGAGQENMQIVAQAVDHEQNLVVIGYTGANTAERRTVLHKVDQAGNILWTRTYTGEAGSISNSPSDLKLDSKGNIYISGTSDMAGTSERFLLRYSTDGALVWSKFYSYQTGANSLQSFSVGADDAVYLTGISNEGQQEHIVTQKLDATGTIVWEKTYVPEAYDLGEEVVIGADNTGAVFVATNARGYQSNYNFTLLKYSAATGDVLLTQQYGSNTLPSREMMERLIISPSGNVYVFTSAKNTVVSGNYTDLFLYVISNTGNLLNRVRVAEGVAYKDGVPIFYLTDAKFNANNELILLCTNARYRSYHDYFISKYSPDGTRAWLKTLNEYEGSNIKQFVAKKLAILDNQEIAAIGEYSVFIEINGFPPVRQVIETSKLILALFNQSGNETWRQLNQKDGNIENYGIGISKIKGKSVYATGGVAGTQASTFAMKFADCSGFTASAGADKEICTGGNVQLQASGGITYSWAPATGLSATNIANPVASPSATTTYTVTVTNADGCTDTDEVIVKVNAKPTATITANGETTFCQGGSVLLTANSGTDYSYQWLKNGTPINQATAKTYTAETAGDYSVIVESAGGCSTTSAVVKVNIAAAVTAVAGDDKTICAGENVQLQASGGTTYSWSPVTGLSAANIASPVASPAQTTTYTVTVTNANGCSATDQVTVRVNPAPAATITTGGTTTFCEGGSLTLTANTGSGLTYQWLKDGNPINNATGNSFATNAAGDFAVRVTNSNGCTTTSAVTKVTVNTPPVVNAGNDQSICVNAEALTLTEFSPAGGTWSGPGVSANGLFNPTTAGVGTHTLTYTVTQNSCTVKATKTVTVTPAVATSAGNIAGETNICAGSTNLTYSIPAVTGATSYIWSVPNGFTITGGQGTRTITVTAGTTSGSISVKAQNGCGSSEPATITVNVSAVPAASITTSGSTTLCAGGSVTLTANAGSGLTYQWLRNGSAINNATGNTYTANAAGDYAVVVRNAGGCSATSTAVRVTVAAAVTASAGEDKTMCAGENVQLQASGGTTYSWSPATGLSATNISNPTASPAQTTTYTVTVTNANGCTDTDQVTVTVNAVPAATITANGNTSFCEGGSVTLQANTGNNYSYQWQRNGSDISGATAATYNATTSGNYTVIISSGNCSGTADAMAVNVSSNIRSNNIASGDQTLCAGAAVATLEGSTPAGGAGTFSYQWQQSTDGNSYTNIQGATGQNYTPGNLSATTWFRRVVTSGSCSSTSEAVKVTLNSMPTVSLSAFDKTCVQGTTITLTGGQPAGGTYSGPGVSNGIFNPATAGAGTHTISYSYTGAGNCSATATQTIVVEAACTPTGVEDEEPPHKFVMYPNPAKNKLYLEADLPQRTDATLRLVDARGRIILEKTYTGQAGTFTETIQLENAARGLYILQFTTKEGMYSRRVVLW